MSILNAITAGAGGVALSGDTSGNLTIQSAGTNVATFVTTGDVGIGTTTPTDPNGYGRGLNVVGSAGAALYAGSASQKAVFGLSGSDVVIQNSGTGKYTFFTNGSELMRIDSSGNLSLGQTAANGKLSIFGVNADWNLNSSVGGSAGGTKLHIRFLGDAAVAGTVTSSGTSTTYGTSSDYRLKENVSPMQNALATVSALKPVTYTWKSDGKQSQGFIAHELQEVCPEAVVGEKDAIDKDGNIVPQVIDTSFLVATLTAAIQELSAEINALKAKVGA